VRPNQGLIAPGSTEKVAIMLVEKDKNSLLQSYERLGQSALDHAKDKFLVQSCTVSKEFSSKYMDTKNKGSDNTQLYEALNTMWSSAGSGANKSMENKKLHVRLAVKDGNNSQGTAKSLTSAQASMLKPHETSQEDVENMTPPQLFAEISSLRKKYDELVSFSVNLTAERDILNNTLEQTKRELNKEMANRSALENKGSGGGGDAGASAGAAKGNFILTLLTMLVVGAACFGAGVREAKLGRMDFIVDVPHVGELFVPEGTAAAGVEATKERILDSSDD
jgi:hypothetical protein